MAAGARVRARPWGIARVKRRDRDGIRPGSPFTSLTARATLQPTSCTALARVPQACGRVTMA